MTYLASLQLEKEPFSTSPDPAFFYQSTQHRTVLNRLEIAIRLKRGLNLILGDIGTGKSTLSRTLIQLFSHDDDYIFHLILDPGFKSEYQFLTHLTKIFGINPFFKSTIDHKEAIEKYLFQKAVEEQKTVVLIIDEGQKLQQSQLEVLRTLLNYETNEYKLLQLVIFGQMELLPRVKSMANFMDRVSYKCMIQALDEYETGELIDFRLKQAGYHGIQSLFDVEAKHKVYQHTEGYPRRISRMCQRAMEYLIMSGDEVVTGELIDKIIEQEQLWN